MAKFNFTNNKLIKLKNTTNKYETHYDTGQPGLQLRITPHGVKTFRFHAWDKLYQRTVTLTIGRYPTVSIASARKIARKKIDGLAEGTNIHEQERSARAEQTLSEVFETWLENHAKENIKRWAQDERRYELYIKPHLGNMKLSSITPDAIIKWRNKLTKQKKQRGTGEFLSKGLIHRAFIVLSSVFSKAAPQIPNPCFQVKKYKANTRTIFLKSDELNYFFTALNDPATPDYLRDYLLLSLYTGARKSNVLAMNWNHIDLSLKLWSIPGDQMKNTEPMVIPLLDQVVAILQRRKKAASSVFVFPSPRESKTGHFMEPKKAWKSLLKRAGLPGTYRLHDLRRTMGSWQAITGTSTKIIGASLGHKSEQATAHYAHLTIEPVRAAMQRAADAMDAQKDIEKVVE